MTTEKTTGTGFTSLAERFAEVARRTPDAPAVEEPDRVIDYQELARRVIAVASRLRRHGAERDRVVAVLADRTAALPTAVLAAWYTGAAPLALDPRTPRDRLRTILDEVKPTVAVTVNATRFRFAGCGVPLLAIDDDRGPLPPAIGGGYEASDPWPVDPDNLAYVIHTSGSTGSAKAVGVTQRALVAIVDDWTRLYGLGTEVTSVLQVAGFGFDVAMGDIVRALLTGCRLVMCPRETVLSPPELHAYLRRTRPQFAELTPTLLRPLVSHLATTGDRLDFLRCLVAGGESWTSAEREAAAAIVGRRTRIFNTYGLTETTVDTTYHEATGYIGPSVPIGRPFPSASLAVLDEDLKPVDQGELYVVGTQLARGYLVDPGMTAQRFVPAPHGPPGARAYRTGDRVRRLPTGELVHLGRTDDQVKVRGVRVYLAEVERALAGYAGTRGAVVVQHDWDVNGERCVELAAYVVPANDRLDTDDLRRHLERVLPSAMVPAFVTVVAELPVTANGKVDRTRLPPPAALAEKPDPAAAGVANDGVEAGVSSIWRRVLGRSVPGRHANLFECGGNSVLAARIVALIRAELGVDLSLGALLAHGNIAEVAGLVRRALPAPPVPTDPDRIEGPLSPAQQRLWLLDQMTNGLADYNIPAVIGMSDQPDVTALRAALRHLIDRHDVLRTAFVPTAQGPMQRVRPTPDLDLLETLGPETGDPIEWCRRYVRRPFDLAAPPLLRVALLETGSRHVLVLVLPHIVSDGVTLRVLLRELGIIYSALVSGVEPPPLPPLPLRYLDYAAWHADRLARGEFTDQLAYWRDRLTGAPLPAELPWSPTASDEPSGPTRLTAALGSELSDVVRGLAAELSVTPFVLLLVAFTSVLGRWSGTDDVVVGAPFGDRIVPGTENLAGFFVNTLPLRIHIPLGASLAEAVALARAAVADAADAQDVPFDLMQRELRRSGAATPFRTWFNYLGAPEDPPDMTGLRTEMLQPPVVGALFDLNAYVTEYPDGFVVELICDVARIDTGHASAFLDQFVQLLRRVTVDPDAPLDTHPLGSVPADPATPGQPAPNRSLPAMVLGAATRRPQAIAVRGAQGSATYRELTRRAGGVADLLRGHRIGAEDVVAVYGVRDASLAIALLGVLAAGAAFTVLDPAYPADRLVAQLADTSPVALLLPAGAGTPPEELRSTTPMVIDLGAMPEPSAPMPGDTEHGLAYVAFTSGTTGRPRAVYGDQPPVAHFVLIYTRAYAIGPADRFAMLAGLGHDPLLRDVFVPLCAGATLCVPGPDLLHSPRELLRWLAAERVTVVHVTPSLVRLLGGAVGAVNSAPSKPPTSLRLVVCGGEQLRWSDVATVRRLAPGATMVNAYGTTETPQVVAWNPIRPDEPLGPPEGAVPIGKGIDGVELRVVTAAGQPAAVGEVGRVVVRTPHLTRGLGGSYETGDIGRRRPDGETVLVGRADDQIVLMGHRIEPAEIDLRAVRLPYVRDCVTRLPPAGQDEPRLISYIVPAGSEPVTLAMLRNDLRSELPDYMLPSGVVLLKELPLTPNGKIDAVALAERPAEPLVSGGDTAPHGHLERSVARIWREALRLRSVPVDASFFDLGGTSLLMAQVQSRLELLVGREVPIVAMFAHPTVQSLAAYLSGVDSPLASSARRARAAPQDASRWRAVRRRLWDQVDTRTETG